MVKVGARSNQATKVQECLTKHGCNIRTRLGLHEVSPESCTEDGLIILEMGNNPEEAKHLQQDLEKLEGVSCHYLEM
ncbi:MAG: hypothetical protein WCP87_07205 [Atribacterota bacterium]